MGKVQFPTLEFVKIEQRDSIAHVVLANPKKANAIHKKMWFELEAAALAIQEKKDVIRAVVLSGEGKHFSAGVHLNFLKEIFGECRKLPKEQRPAQLKIRILEMQKAFHRFFEMPQPVIAAVHGACIGAGVDLICACDIRISTVSSVFCIAETKLGIVADIGTLQRAPYFMSEGRLRELSYTSQPFGGLAAKRWGLVNHLTFTRSQLLRKAFQLASQMVALQDYAVFGTKKILNENRRKTINATLDGVADFNSHLLCSDAAEAFFAKIL